MQRLNAASCLFFAFLSAASVCRAGGPLSVEVVQTHTGVKLGSHALELVSASESTWSRCSDSTGSYSKPFAFHCGASTFVHPEQFHGVRDYAFFYDVRVIMPDEAHLVFHCSTIVDRDCAGFPEYPGGTSVECLDFVYRGSAYKDCTAKSSSAERIAVYRASLQGSRMTIFGSNWRRSYLQYGTWQLESPAAQDSKPQQDPKPADPAPTSDPKPAQTSEAKPASAPDDRSTSPMPSASAPNPTAPMLLLTADQAIDPRVIEQAKAGDAEAQYKLGYDYYLGRGVPVDYVQAAIWWRKAAEQGYPQAQNNLGVLYNSGKGVPQSYAEAYFWQNLAAARASGSLQTQFAKNRDESASKLWFIARLKVQQRAAKWAADHPVQPRSHEPTDAKRGDYP